MMNPSFQPSDWDNPPFVPPEQLVIFETKHWRVDHRCDTIYPGYLMVSAKDPKAVFLSNLSTTAQSELGPLLARTSKLLRECFGALHVYDGRYGHSPGHSVHYHVIPVYDWTVSAYLRDGRYRALQQFYGPELSSPEDFDGADMTLFIWRSFAEAGVEAPKIDSLTVDEVVARLRSEFGMTPSARNTIT